MVKILTRANFWNLQQHQPHVLMTDRYFFVRRIINMHLLNHANKSEIRVDTSTAAVTVAVAVAAELR